MMVHGWARGLLHSLYRLWTSRDAFLSFLVQIFFKASVLQKNIVQLIRKTSGEEYLAYAFLLIFGAAFPLATFFLQDSNSLFVFGIVMSFFFLLILIAALHHNTRTLFLDSNKIVVKTPFRTTSYPLRDLDGLIKQYVLPGYGEQSATSVSLILSIRKQHEPHEQPGQHEQPEQRGKRKILVTLKTKTKQQFNEMQRFIAQLQEYQKSIVARIQFVDQYHRFYEIVGGKVYGLVADKPEELPLGEEGSWEPMRDEYGWFFGKT